MFSLRFAILICWLGCGPAIDPWKITTTDPGSIQSAFCMALPKNPQNDISQEIDPTPANKWGVFVRKNEIMFK